MSQYQLAQINIVKLKYALTDERIKDFVDGLQPIDQLVERR